MMYRAAFDFGVKRRIDWADDLAAFHGHIQRVREHIAVRKSVEDVRVIADIGAGSLTLDFLIEADSPHTAESNAMDIVSLAIRECGARHLGLYPEALESHLKSRMNAFSGLRTPVWQRRRILISDAA